VGHLIVAVIFMSFPQSLGFATDTPAQDRLRQATQLISEEKFEAARQILEAMLAASEHPPPETYCQLTLCYLKQTEWKKAEETLQTFLRLSPENFLALYLKGYLLFSTQRYEEPLRVLEPLIERQPGNTASHKVIGLDHFMLGRIEQAEAEMKRATELAPKDAEALYYLGRIVTTAWIHQVGDSASSRRVRNEFHRSEWSARRWLGHRLGDRFRKVSRTRRAVSKG
jgi:tetratricopeptide (TPR) repeat protein